MNTKLIALSVIAGLSFTACGDKDTENPENAENACNACTACNACNACGAA